MNVYLRPREEAHSTVELAFGQTTTNDIERCPNYAEKLLADECALPHPTFLSQTSERLGGSLEASMIVQYTHQQQSLCLRPFQPVQYRHESEKPTLADYHQTHRAHCRVSL